MFNNFKQIAALFLVGAALPALVVSPGCCRRGEEKSAPKAASPAGDLSGRWLSDIQSGEELMTRSEFELTQTADSVSLRLVSLKSPQGDELVPQNMWLDAIGRWEGKRIVFASRSWVSGKDTCLFKMRGELDPEGKLLLHIPPNLCGETSLPYTRTLYRAAP